MDKELFLALYDIKDFMRDALEVDVTPYGVWFNGQFVTVSQLKSMKKLFGSYIKQCNSVK